MSEAKQITVSEFLMWLEGVEEMQEDDWSPSQSQWARIRGKINSIGVSPQSNPQVVYRESANQPHPREYVQPVEPPAQSRDVVVHRAAGGLTNIQPAPPSNNPLFANADNPSSPVRTPNIDTSDGSGYKPAFV